MTRSPRLVGTFAALVALAGGCKQRGVADQESPSEPGEGVTALDPPRRADGIRPDSVRLDTLSRLQPGDLASVSAEPVVGWTGPGKQPFEVLIRTEDRTGATTRAFGTISRRNSARERSLGQYPCTSCHLGRAIVMRDERIKDAHQDIKPLHPAQTKAACSTCHAPDNVERLALKSGERATLDHTYQLCAQCHFGQARSWAGGAHGKRLDGWQGRRVVMGCADCHDPHRPAIGPRIPFRAPTLERRR